MKNLTTLHVSILLILSESALRTDKKGDYILSVPTSVRRSGRLNANPIIKDLQKRGLVSSDGSELTEYGKDFLNQQRAKI